MRMAIKILARIMHKLSTAVPQSSTLTALYCLGLLGVLHEYACGALRCTPCHRGACSTSSRKPMHYPGYVPMFLLGFGSAMLLAAWNPLPVVAQSAELQPATSQEYDRYVANLEAELEAKGQSEDFFMGTRVCRETEPGEEWRGGGGAI